MQSFLMKRPSQQAQVNIRGSGNKVSFQKKGLPGFEVNLFRTVLYVVCGRGGGGGGVSKSLLFLDWLKVNL